MIVADELPRRQEEDACSGGIAAITSAVAPSHVTPNGQSRISNTNGRDEPTKACNPPSRHRATPGSEGTIQQVGGWTAPPAAAPAFHKLSLCEYPLNDQMAFTQLGNNLKKGTK